MTPHDEWDFDGINEMILADINVKGKPTKALVHFDRNGFGYTLDRATGELLVAEKFDPTVNWATHVDMKTGRPQVVAQVLDARRTGRTSTPRASARRRSARKDQQPAAFNPKTKLFYVPTNHVCMDYEPFKVEYTAGQPYVGATLSMFPAPGSHGGMGNFIAWDAGTGKIVQSKPEKFSVWSGALVTAGGIVCYGTLEGYLKCVDANDINKELYKFKTPSGIIGNVFTYEHKGKQYIGVLSGIGGWAGIGMAAGLREGHRRPGRGGRLQGAGEVHRPRWRADRVLLAVNRIRAQALKGWHPVGVPAFLISEGPPSMKRMQRSAGMAFALALLALNAAVAADPTPYKVADGNKVDKVTLEGLRTWRALACERCHGARQEGMVGPSLLDSLKTTHRRKSSSNRS